MNKGISVDPKSGTEYPNPVYMQFKRIGEDYINKQIEGRKPSEKELVSHIEAARRKQASFLAETFPGYSIKIYDKSSEVNDVWGTTAFNNDYELVDSGDMRILMIPHKPVKFTVKIGADERVYNMFEDRKTGMIFDQRGSSTSRSGIPYGNANDFLKRTQEENR